MKAIEKKLCGNSSFLERKNDVRRIKCDESHKPRKKARKKGHDGCWTK